MVGRGRGRGGCWVVGGDRESRSERERQEGKGDDGKWNSWPAARVFIDRPQQQGD